MTAVLAPAFAATRLEPVGDWHPTRCPPTLTGDPDRFYTEGDKLLERATVFWSIDGEPLDLDEWQTWLIRRLLEVYPPWWPVAHLRGQLRFKHFVVSLARQNGKSVIGALLAFYWLTMHVRVPRIGLFASREEQARIVYSRVYQAIENNPALSAELRHTLTKGIHHRRGAGRLDTHPAKETALQGEPFTACLYDELHLGNMGLWDAVKIGQRAKRAAQLGGITTAGDDASLLLKRLYVEGGAAIADAESVVTAAQECLKADDPTSIDAYQRLLTGAERFGFFVWEAPAAELTEANVIAANPAVACGRIPLSEVMADSAKTWEAGPDEEGVTGRDRVTRYTLNRFLDGVADAWVSSGVFNRLADPARVAGIDPGPVVYGLERTSEWEWASITANYVSNGRMYSELVASIEAPTQADLLRACGDLAGGQTTFAMPADTLKPLGVELREHGHTVWTLGVSEMKAAYATVKAAVERDGLTHAGDPLVTLQSSRAKVRTDEAGGRISRTLSIGDTDAVLAMIAGLFVAENTVTAGPQLF